MAKSVRTRQGLSIRSSRPSGRLRQPVTEPSSFLPSRKSHELGRSDKEIWFDTRALQTLSHAGSR